MDCSTPGSSVHGILQARILEWVSTSFSRGSSWPRDQTHVSYVPWIAGKFFTTEPSGKPLALLTICSRSPRAGLQNRARMMEANAHWSQEQVPNWERGPEGVWAELGYYLPQPSSPLWNMVYGGLITKSCLTLSTPWTVACQAPLSMEFSRQEYWGGLPFPSPGDLPNPGIEPGFPALQADSLPTELWRKPHYGT